MQIRSNSRRLALCSLLLLAGGSAAQDSSVPGTSAFCLFELPGGGERRTFINLAIVQYVELARNELKIAYGGGNFGSGHVARLSAKTPEERDALLARLKKTARECQEKSS